MKEESSVMAITFSVASGDPQLAISYPGDHQVSNAQDAYAAAVMHDTGPVGHDLDNNFQQPVHFN